MLSRVAENLYWISRYVERTENVARLLDVGFHLELDASALSRAAGDLGPVESVLTILNCHEVFRKSQGAAYDPGEPDREAVLHFLTFDRLNPHSITAMLGRARENARASQETLSAEAWSQVNKLLFIFTRPAGLAEVPRQPLALLRRDQAGLHPLRRPRRRHAPAKRGLPLPPARPLPRTGEPGQPHPRHQDARHPRRRPPERPADARRPLVEPVAELLGVRSVPPRAPRPDRPGRGGRLPRVGAPLPPGPAVLRHALRRVAPRDFRGRRRGRGTRRRPNACSAGSTASCATSTVQEIFGQGLSRFLVGIQQACNRVGDEIHQAYFHT